MAETGNFLSGRKRSPLGFAVSQPIPAQGYLEKRFIIAVIVVSHGKPTLHVGVLKFVTASSDSRMGLVFGGVDCWRHVLASDLAGNRLSGGRMISGEKNRGETVAHVGLKRLALAWAQANGFPIAASEVRVPRSGYRADVAAIGRGAGARTAVFECKQSRTDLLKDRHAEADTRARLDELTERRRTLEALLAVHRPDLRRGEALWPEFDAWDFSTLEHRGYHSLLAELETVQRRVLRGTKFSKMYRYRCADFLYLVVEDGICAEAEIPAGWGMLVRCGDEVRLARPPATLEPMPAQRSALLEAIAAAGTRAVNRAAGVTLSGVWTSREIT